MNILTLTNETYPYKWPTISVLLEKNLSELVDNIVFVSVKLSDEKIIETFYKENKYYNLIPASKINKINNLITNLRNKYIMKNVAESMINDKKIDIIIVRNGILEGYIGLYLRRKYNIPVVFMLTDLPYYYHLLDLKKGIKHFLKYIKASFEEILTKNIIKRADMLSSTNGISKFYSKKIKIRSTHSLKSAAPTSFIHFDKKPSYDSKNLIVSFGTIAPERNPTFLLKVVDKIKENKLFDVKLHIIYRDKNELHSDSLRKTIKSMNLEKQIELIENIEYSEMPKYVSKANLSISAIPPVLSYKLSTPIKVIESLSVGIPVVANSEIIDQKNVLLKSKGGILTRYNVNEFAKAVEWLLAHPPMAEVMGQRGKIWIKKHRSHKIEANFFHRTLENLL